MQILDGKIAAAAVKENLKTEVSQLLAEGKRAPHLAVILVGNNGASETYVASKQKNSHEIGFLSTLVRLEESVSEDELLAEIKKLNEDKTVDGILVQLPLPKHIREQKVIETIDPNKDVDGFHPVSAGNLVLGIPTFVPATPYGNCTVTICHSHTPNLKELCLQGDIVVAALGKPGFVKEDMVKEGAVVIDVGITRVADDTKKSGFRIAGDVDFENVAPKTSFITPVPGGVGLMTIAGLLKNTLVAYKKAEGIA